MKQKSWRTTVAAIVAAIGLIAPQVLLLLDGDPLTTPDWTVVMGAITTAVAIVVMGKTARDDVVTSEGRVAPKDQ